MPACGYEFYLLVFNSRYREISSWALEDKIHIHKRACSILYVLNTLFLRAQTLVSEEVNKVKEFQHVKKSLKDNNYPDWMLTTPNTGSASRDSEESESVNEKRIYVSVSYIKGTFSELLRRAFKSREVTLVHNPFNHVRSQLVRVKDKTESLKKRGQFTTSIANSKDYDIKIVWAKPLRLLETRVKEHFSWNSSLRWIRTKCPSFKYFKHGASL